MSRYHCLLSGKTGYCLMGNRE